MHIKPLKDHFRFKTLTKTYIQSLIHFRKTQLIAWKQFQLIPNHSIRIMLDLNIGIRSVAFLFLNSTFFTACNQDRYLVGSYEQQTDVGSVSSYTNTYNYTCNILMYNPNSIPNQGTYKRIAHEGDANVISAVWIQGFNSSHMNPSRGFNVIVVCSSVEDSFIPKDFRLFFSHSLWQKETLDFVSSAAVQNSDFTERKLLRFV